MQAKLTGVSFSCFGMLARGRELGLLRASARTRAAQYRHTALKTRAKNITSGITSIKRYAPRAYAETLLLA